jgi:hypothetical protein
MVPCILRVLSDACMMDDIYDVPVDGPELARVVVSILRTGNSVEIKIDTDTVFTSPPNSLEEVSIKR